MKVKFEITREDYEKFNKYCIFNVPEVRRTIISLIIIIYAIALAGALSLKIFMPISNLMVVLITIVGGGILNLRAYYSFIKKGAGSNLEKKGCFCEHTIEINEEGVREITSVNDGFWKWEGIKDVIENEEYIFIFISTSEIHTIPKRAFNSTEEASEFYRKSIEFLKSKENVVKS